jgi:hypothetical protein
MTESKCVSCGGTGEMVREQGPTDCPDCGGTGRLPSRATLIDWRARDIDRAAASGRELGADDARWLVSELRNARSALTQIIALAHDIDDGDAIAVRIRFAANKVLGLYETGKLGSIPPAGASTASSPTPQK